MMNVLRIAWIAVRELFYERVFYILLSFGALSLGLSLLLGQMTYAEQYKLTLDFMLAGMQISMTLFSVFVSISLFQREMLTGSVSMVLSKPISRTTFLVGKFIGQSVMQLGVTVAMALVTFAMCASYQRVSVVSLSQVTLFIFFEVTVLSAITYFFAVNAGAVTTSVVTLWLFCLGHLRGSLSQNLNDSSGYYFIWKLVKNVIPDLEVFNMKALASYGFSISAAEVGWATVYAFCCVSFFLLIASITFNRKDILT